MFISIIIPTFNRSNTIQRAIESVLNQTYKKFELIIIDDGSNDSTKNIVSNYNLKYYFQENSGVSSARNKGIQKASSNWIAFLDSDDKWHETKLEKQVKFHKKNSDIMISQTEENWIRDGVFVNKPEKYKKLDGNIFKHSIDICSITASSVIINKVIFEDIGYFDENLEICEDYDMWLRITRKYNIGLIKECLISKYAGEKNQLSTKYFAMDIFRVKALKKHLYLKNKYLNTIFYKKCKILKQGAIKHNNIKLIMDINELLN